MTWKEIVCLPNNVNRKWTFPYQTIWTRVLCVRANCMRKVGCFKHSAIWKSKFLIEIFFLLDYVLIKPQLNCNWKKKSYHSLHELCSKDFRSVLFVWLFKVIDYFDYYFNSTMSVNKGMWSFKHYSQLIVILLTIDFTAPYKLLFLFHETTIEKKPFLANNYFAFSS